MLDSERLELALHYVVLPIEGALDLFVETRIFLLCWKGSLLDFASSRRNVLSRCGS